MSVWSILNEERKQEGICAALAVQAIQAGKDPSYYMEHAAEHRALAYEFKATGDIIRPLRKARYEEILGARAS